MYEDRMQRLLRSAVCGTRWTFGQTRPIGISLTFLWHLSQVIVGSGRCFPAKALVIIVAVQTSLLGLFLRKYSRRTCISSS